MTDRHHSVHWLLEERDDHHLIWAVAFMLAGVIALAPTVWEPFASILQNPPTPDRFIIPEPPAQPLIEDILVPPPPPKMETDFRTV